MMSSLEAIKGDIFEWDVKNWSRALPLWEKHLNEGIGQKALTLGERGGGLSLYLAKHNFQVTCTDLREFPETTKVLHKKHNVTENIIYQNENVLKLSFEENTFDVVMFKSVIGALSSKENQQKAINEIYRVLKPGGKLLFAENSEGSRLHKYARKKFVSWDNYWRYLQYSKDQDLWNNFSEKTFESHGFFGAFGRNNKQRNLLGKVDSLAQKMVTRSMRYIMAGVCVK